MLVYFGTVCRGAAVRDGGELVALDWATKTVRARRSIYPDDPPVDKDPNPRGNTRGCRGIVQCGDKILAANYHSVQIFDLDLNHIRNLSNDLFVGLHEIFLDNHRLWVTSTTIDAVLCFDINSNRLVESYWIREMKGIAKHFSLEPAKIDKSIDNRLLHLSTKHLEHPSHTHVNAVAVHDGRVYGLIKSYGAVVDLTKDRVVVETPELVGSHNLHIDASGYMYVNHTPKQFVRVFDSSSGKLIKHIDLKSSPDIRRLRRRTWLPHKTRTFLNKIGIAVRCSGRPLFLRGLAKCDNRVLVGMSPAAIAEIDLETGDVCDFYQYSNDVNVCIHGLSIVTPSRTTQGQSGPSQMCVHDAVSSSSRSESREDAQ